MPRKLRVEFPGAVHHVISRGDRQEAIFLDDVGCHDFLKTLAEELARMGWSEEELAERRKGDPGKMALEGRQRRETTLTVQAIAARLHLGTSKSANVRLHSWMRGGTPLQGKEEHS